MRFLLAMLLLSFSARATIYTDAWITMSNQTVGSTITSTIMNNGTLGTHGGYSFTPSTPTGYTVGNSFISSVTPYMVGFTNKPIGAPYVKCIQLDNTKNFTYLRWDLPSGKNEAVVAAWIQMGMANGTSSTKLYDLMSLYTVGGQWAVLQLEDTPGSFLINMETNPGGVTTHNGETAISQGGNYYCVLYAKPSTQACEFWVYNTSMTLVAHSTGTMASGGTTVQHSRIGNAEVGTSTGTTKWQDISMSWTYPEVQTANNGLKLPPDRQADWTNAGFAIPNVTTIGANVSAGASVATVKAALDSCASNTVCKLAAGTYTFTSPLAFTGAQNGVVLRGTIVSGTNASIIYWSGTRGIQVYRNFDETVQSTEANITANIRKGSSTITLTSVPSWVTVNELVGIDQLNDDVMTTQDTCREPNDIYRNKVNAGSNGVRGQGEMVRVTAKSGTTITTTHPILNDYATSRTAQIYQPGYNPSTTTSIKMCGVEDLYMEGTGGASSHAFAINVYCAQKCWIKNVTSYKSRSIHFEPNFTYQCVITGCFVWDSWTFAATGEAYGMPLYNICTRNLIYDNIIRRCGPGLQANYGSCGNVFAYNYVLDAHSDTKDSPDISTHGNSASYNLFEGNVGTGKAKFDCIHGSSSFNTLFRGRQFGKNDGEIALGNSENQVAVDVDYWNHNTTLLGNVLGTTGYHDTRLNQAPASCSSLDQIVMKYGYANSFGCDSTGDATYGMGVNCGSSPHYDTLAQMNIIEHGNWDAITAGIVYDSTISDHTLADSLYLSAKPSWFGDRIWPANDPSSPLTAVATNIPAGYRYVFLVNPPNGSSIPLVTSPTNQTVTNFVAMIPYQTTSDQTITSYGATGVPNGLSMNTGTGLLSGTPNIANSTVTTNITIGVTNANGGSTTNLGLTITALANPVINSATNLSSADGAPLTYQILATQYPTSFGATSLPSGITVNGSSGLISGTPSGTGEFDSVIYATNAVGSDTENLHFSIVASPLLTVLPTSLTFDEIPETTTATLTFGLTNAGSGGSTLTGHVHTTSAPFTIIGSTNFSLAGSLGTNITIQYAPTTKGTNTSTLIFVSNGGGSTNNLTGVSYPLATSLPMLFTNALINPPFVVNASSNTISQPANTIGAPFTGGRAVHGFVVTNTGSYTFSGIVYCAGGTDDSVYVGMDSDPVDVSDEWSWNGPLNLVSKILTVDRDGPPYPITFPHVFVLTAGNHKVVVFGREGGAQLRSMTFTQLASTTVTNLAIIGVTTIKGTATSR